MSEVQFLHKLKADLTQKSDNQGLLRTFEGFFDAQKKYLLRKLNE